MSRDHIRVIDDYRYCHDNEFFFTYDPKRTTGTKQLLEYLEKNFNIVFTYSILKFFNHNSVKYFYYKII